MLGAELDDLYSFLAQRRSVNAAQKRLRSTYETIRRAGDIESLRLSRGPYKKLQDEVGPALIYAAHELTHDAEIQFHLSDRGRDVTVWPAPHARPISLEVTVALGKVRFHQMTALNNTGIGHGFTDATDDDSHQLIRTRYEGYCGYSTDEATDNIATAIQRCVRSKSRHDCTVVIAVPLDVLSPRHWQQLMPEIARHLPQSSCTAIFVVGNSDGGEVCYRIK